MAGAISRCCRNISPKTIWSRTAGTPAKGESPRPAARRPPDNWCKPGSTAARNVRRKPLEPGFDRIKTRLYFFIDAFSSREPVSTSLENALTFLRRPAIGLGAGAAHQHRPFGGAQAIGLQERLHALLVIDDRKRPRPVGAPQAALETPGIEHARER